jgi:glycosyltransferase involved in cell wall biosynthesis
VLTRPGFPLDTKPELTAGDIAAEDVIDGVRFIRTLEPQRTPGMPVLAYMQAAATVMEERLRELRPQVVIAASNYRTALPALIASRRLGIPFVYEVRGFWEVTRISREPEYEDTPAYATQSLMEAKVAQLADHVFTLTGPMREELVSRGVPAGKIELLPNSCDPQRFLPRERDRQLAARWSIPDGVPVIGYIGTFVDYEGLEDLALACALLKKRGIEFRLLLVGNENASGQDRGPITEQILSVARSEGFSEWLVMPGRVPHEEVESYYSLIDIAPFPRKPLPVCEMVSPMKPLEALAMEKAVVVSSVQALVEMIDDGNTGRVFEKGNVAALADVLNELIKQPEQREALGKRGRQWVSTERTWNQVGQKFHQVVQGKLSRDQSQSRSTVLRKAVPSGDATPSRAVKEAPTAARRTTPSRIQDLKPQWWTQIDKSFRER